MLSEDKRFRKKEPTNLEIKLRVTASEDKKIRKDAEAWPSIMAYLRSKLL